MKFPVLENSDPLKSDCVYNAVANVLVNRKQIILSLICMTSILHCPGSSGS